MLNLRHKRLGIIFFVWIPVVLGVSLWFLLGKGPSEPSAVSSSFKEGTRSQRTQGPQEDPSIQSNELIWAGLSGNEPKYFESGENKGLGYLEVHTALVRKALENAGFKLRYEYFSPARISHEFKRNAPICFYPFDWRDPSSYFKTPVDRIVSVALNFKGEENRSIVFRQGEAARFKKHLDEKGELRLQSLLKDGELKTLIPSASGVHSDLGDVYRIQKDGSLEINANYRRHIETRVLRENSQLVQMLNGRRVDYLLSEFITPEDYKMIKQGESAFERLSYRSQMIASISDPRVNLTSVACSLNPLSVEAMPHINQGIVENRGVRWLQRVLRYQKRFEPALELPDFFGILQWRFYGQISSREADAWYPHQTKQVPGLRQFPPESDTKASLPAIKAVSQFSAPKWLALQPRVGSIWLIHESDYLDLKYSKTPRWDFDHLCTEPSLISLFRRSLSESELSALLQAKELFGDEKVENVFQKLGQRQKGGIETLDSLGIMANGLKAEAVGSVLPLLGGLKSVAVIGGQGGVLDLILPKLSQDLEGLNLTSSTLGQVELAPLIRGMPNLRALSLSAAQLKTSDLARAMLGLPATLVELKLGWNQKPWTPGFAAQFGHQRFLNLEVLDLSNNALDDRYCAVIRDKERLRVLKLNGNFFTSNCLSEAFKSGLPSLRTLELAEALISKKRFAVLKIPQGVKELDLTETQLDSTLLAHLVFPMGIKSLRLAGNDVDASSFAEIAKHLDPVVDLLDLGDNPKLGGSVLRSLSEAKVIEVKGLDLRSVRFDTQSLKSNSVKKIESLVLANAEVSNQTLREIADLWGASLRSIDLSENVLTDLGTNYLLSKSPGLRDLSLNEVIGFDGVSLAAQLPQGLVSLKLANNGTTDREFEVLSPRLPKTLKYLEIFGSFFGPRGAKALALNFPALLTFVATHAIDEASASWLLSYLPPSLRELYFGPVSLGVRATETFLSHIPPRLETLAFRSVELELEDSTRFFRALPEGLRRLDFNGKCSIGRRGIDPKAKELLPRNLKFLNLHTTGISSPTLVKALEDAPPSLRFIVLRNSGASEEVFQEILNQAKDHSQVHFQLAYVPVNPDFAKDFASLGARSFSRVGCPGKGFDFSELSKEALSSLKWFALMSCPVPMNQLISVLRNLPPALLVLELRSIGLKYADVDTLIAELPRGLRTLVLAGNEFGPLGVQKLRRYKQRIEAETGFHLDLRTE